MCRQSLTRPLLSGTNISFFMWKYLSSYSLSSLVLSSISIIAVALRHLVSESPRVSLASSDGLFTKGATLEPNFYAYNFIRSSFAPFILF